MSGWYLETTGPRILHHNSELDEGRRSGLRGADTRVCSVETRLDVVRGVHEMFGSASRPAPLVRTASRRVSTLPTRVSAPRRHPARYAVVGCFHAADVQDAHAEPTPADQHSRPRRRRSYFRHLPGPAVQRSRMDGRTGAPSVGAGCHVVA